MRFIDVVNPITRAARDIAAAFKAKYPQLSTAPSEGWEERTYWVKQYIFKNSSLVYFNLEIKFIPNSTDPYVGNNIEIVITMVADSAIVAKAEANIELNSDLGQNEVYSEIMRAHAWEKFAEQL